MQSARFGSALRIDKKVAHGMLDTAVLERVGWARHERIPDARNVIAQMLDQVPLETPQE